MGIRLEIIGDRLAGRYLLLKDRRLGLNIISQIIMFSATNLRINTGIKIAFDPYN